MKSIYQIELLLLLSFGLFTGCVSNPSVIDLPTSTPDVVEISPSISPTPALPRFNEQAEEITQLVISDLARELSISEDEIEVVSVDTVEWQDTSLGCPDSEMTFTQVVTQGYLIVMNVEGENYFYHADHDQTIFLCESEIPIGEPAKYSDPTVKDGKPNQPKEWGKVDTSRITPPAPVQ